MPELTRQHGWFASVHVAGTNDSSGVNERQIALHSTLRLISFDNLGGPCSKLINVNVTGVRLEYTIRAEEGLGQRLHSNLGLQTQLGRINRGYAGHNVNSARLGGASSNIDQFLITINGLKIANWHDR